MILGIGIDILQLLRFKSLTARRGLEPMARRILSAEELMEFERRSSSSTPCQLQMHLAVRWAAKEAAYKALFPSYKATWKELTLSRHEANPKPNLAFRPIGKEDPKLKFHVSISHDGDYVIAQVLAETM
ncbi:hypothetical protein FRB96_002235 [Tulasnella sp. 330]|nr:hypothetical protein FRB96_002235 [Tulasnella sp. 330]KAG8881709.1 hypothetical protein FRB98_004193 [Tulasnella sp. 332]